jgi:uncharacterized protein (TIGR00730 family)
MKKTNIRSICVFCGAAKGNNPLFEESARRLGTLLAQNGITLVFGGGNAGLMAAVANAALAVGGEVIGVIPDYLVEREHGHRDVTRLDIVDSMHERKRRMFDLADGFISLPGGIGTLEETFEVITWKQLDMHVKPIAIIDVAGYWQNLDGLIAATVEHGFAAPPTRALYRLVATAEDALDALREDAIAGPPTDSARL